jgi:hypothetical protein
MFSMARATAKAYTIVAAVAALLTTAPSHAENFAYVSATGSGTACTAAAPCATVSLALQTTAQPVRVICLNGSQVDNGIATFGQGSLTIDVDCPRGFMAFLGIPAENTNSSVRIRHMGFRGGFGNEVTIQASGNVIFEDCVFEDSPSVALDVEPTGPLNLVIKNSRFSSSGGGILLKPAAGGSIKATLDHVTITSNNGGGIKSDSTNGVINLDISDSEISNNGGNGINAVSGNSQNIVGIKNSVIARNGAAGVQANGANAGILVSTTLLDQNAAGATSVVGGGNIFTFGNSIIIGAAGAGFTATGQLH